MLVVQHRIEQEFQSNPLIRSIRSIRSTRNDGGDGGPDPKSESNRVFQSTSLEPLDPLDHSTRETMAVMAVQTPRANKRAFQSKLLEPLDPGVMVAMAVVCRRANQSKLPTLDQGRWWRCGVPNSHENVRRRWGGFPGGGGATLGGVVEHCQAKRCR